MLDKIKEYAELISKKESAKDGMDTIVFNIKHSPAYIILEDSLNKIEPEIKALDSEIREGAIAKFATDGNKKPWDGIGIRETTKVDYDKALAFDWCKTNLPDALIIDKKKFTKVIVAMDGAGADLPEHITVKTVPTATISKDLSAYL